MMIITVLTNVMGPLLTTFYFWVIDPLPTDQIALQEVGPTIITAFAAVTVLLLFIAVNIVRHTRARLRKWHRRLQIGAPPSDVPADIRRMVLNYVPRNAVANFALWVLGGLLMGLLKGLLVGLQGDAPQAVLRVFIGTVDAGGVLTTAVVYFVNDSVRAFRLPVLGRLLSVFLLIGIGFPVLLVSLSLQRAQALVTAPNPEAILSNLLSLKLFILGATGLAGVALAVLVTRGITAPLRRLQAAMACVEQDDYSVQAPVRVPVTTNDELGYLCERFNGMAEGLERRDLELQTVYQISQDITASLELDQTLQTVLERVRQMIAYDGAEICLYNETENVLRVRAWAGSDRILVDTQGHVYRLGEGYTGWIGEHRQSLLVLDVDAHQAQQPVTRQIADGVLLRSYLGVPLVVGQSMVGTLNLASTRKGTFDDHARQLLETIAPQAAIAIENAAQVLERERRLKEQIERLRIEIDEAKRARQVKAITETEYFQELRKKARHMRGRAGVPSAEQEED